MPDELRQPATSRLHAASTVASYSAAGTTRVDVSVIVVNYNTADLLKDMRRALMASKAALTLQTIVVDNASRDDSLSVIRQEFSDAHLIINPINIGFGRANNQALGVASGRYLLLLNTDAFVAADTLSKTVAYMDAHPDCGVLGVRLVGRDGQVQPSCRYFPTPWNIFLQRSGLARAFPGVQLVDPPPVEDDDAPRECDWVVGCYMLIRSELVAQCGLFDPRYFLYYEEVDFCRRAKAAGWKVVHFPQTTVVHWGGESAKAEGQLTPAGKQISEIQIESELLYYRKNFGLPGLLIFVFLSWVTDLIHAVKWLARGRSWAGLNPVRRHADMVRSLLFRTRIGSVPTR